MSLSTVFTLITPRKIVANFATRADAEQAAKILHLSPTFIEKAAQEDIPRRWTYNVILQVDVGFPLWQGDSLAVYLKYFPENFGAQSTFRENNDGT